MTSYPNPSQSRHPNTLKSQHHAHYGSFNPSDPFGSTRNDLPHPTNVSNRGDSVLDDSGFVMTVSESALTIQLAFVRKVYLILFAQLFGVAIVSWLVSYLHPVAWIRSHLWTLFVALSASLVNLGLLYWKRNSHPTSYLLFTTFTILESWTLGLTVAYYDNVLILRVPLITAGVFLGLAVFTLQNKYSSSGPGAYLFGSISVFVMTGIIGLVIPFGEAFDTVYACGGCLLISAYIVYDTYMLGKRLAPDEFMLGAVMLYLDFVSLFIGVFVGATRMESANIVPDAQRA